MDKGTQNLLNVLISVLAPVMALEHCSAHGDSWWQVGPACAMAIALALPLGFGLYTYLRERRLETLTLVGLLGTILTGVVTLYANTGEGEAIRPDTPWWYAAKEALIALILSGAVLATSREKNSMLRVFVYSDSLFNIKGIEEAIDARQQQPAYQKALLCASYATAGSLLFSAIANFLLALYFLLPVTSLPAAAQPVEYNYAVGKMTWWGYVIIGIPLLATLFLVIRYLARRLSALSGLPEDRLYMR